MRHLVVSLLKARTRTLATWRKQVPTKGQRTKSFENWLLVELVGLIGRERPDAKVRTNGYVGTECEPKNRCRVQPTLRGRKRNANTLSPDLSVLHDGFAAHCELKTGLGGIDLLDDMEIVRDYNRHDAAKRSTACLVWAILLPERDGASTLRSVERICARAHPHCELTFACSGNTAQVLRSRQEPRSSRSVLAV
jgi:hypothetical protein